MMNSNKELVQSLIDCGALKSKSIINAFRKIDRKDFVVDEYKDLVYKDVPLPIGYAQTISQPYTVAFMLELLSPKKGESILDIGSGSGWTTALLSHIVGKKGMVYGLEVIPELVDMGNRNISKYDIKNAKVERVGKELGISGKIFNRILVSASVEEFPKELLEQVKKSGAIVIPIKDSICKITKEKEGNIIEKKYYGFTFVKLRR